MMQSYTVQDEILMKSPLLDPLLLRRNIISPDAGYDGVNPVREEEGPDMESEISENIAKAATIENIIELLLTGAATGFTFSTVAAIRTVEVTRLKKWLNVKLMTKINNQGLRTHFIAVANSFTTSVFTNKAFIIALIDAAFDFKNRIVIKAVSEYTTWLTTKVGGIYAIKEYDPGALPLITKYWNSTPSPPSPVNPAQYWSAAFISWVIKEAGAMDLFAYSGAHITYIRAARRNRRDGIQNPFRLYRVNEFITRMQPGDLLCKARAGSGLTYNNVLTHAHTSAHVDIITEIDLPNNKIRAVGGNVCDNVDHKGLNIVGVNRITNSDGEDYFAGIGIGYA